MGGAILGEGLGDCWQESREQVTMVTASSVGELLPGLLLREGKGRKKMGVGEGGVTSL